MSELSPLMKRKEVAEFLGMSLPTLDRHIKRGMFPQGIRLPNGHPRWQQSTVRQYLEQLQREDQSA